MNLPVSAFIPDASIGIDETSAMQAKEPMAAKAKVLKSELRGIAAARKAVDAKRAHKAASKIDAAVAAEKPLTRSTVRPTAAPAAPPFAPPTAKPAKAPPDVPSLVSMK